MNVKGVYFNASFVNLKMHNYLFAVSCYHEFVEESNKAITFSF